MAFIFPCDFYRSGLFLKTTVRHTCHTHWATIFLLLGHSKSSCQGTHLFWMVTSYVCFLLFNFTSRIFLQGHIFTFSFNIIRNGLYMYEYQFYLSLKAKWHTGFKQVKISFDCVYPLQGQFWFYSITLTSWAGLWHIYSMFNA